ncbi:MAG TPA: OmpA family protein [Patescibacteria group bacterium]|nr:OmpA family protein [Patescibacteria group bacterium]
MPESIPPRDPKPPRKAAAAEDDGGLAELREILFHAERDELLALRERVHDFGQRAHDVSEVLPEAVRLRAEEGADEQLTEALRPTVERTLKESVERDPQVVAEALFPAMGPSIRRAITEYFRTLVQSFDQAMQHSFSIQGIRWRLEAFRTGKSFSEVTLLHSLVYRVEQVLLIHRQTSLLLHRVVAPEIAAMDADMMSGLMSALQDYARDSLHAEKSDALESFRVGESLNCWVEQGPKAMLVAVIRGDAPQAYRVKLREVLERVHAIYGRRLDQFNGDVSAFDPAADLLAESFASQRRQYTMPPPRPYFTWSLATVAAVFLVWRLFLGVQDWRWERFVDVLREQPGYTITSLHRGWFSRYYELRGMRDPQSEDPFVLLEKQGLNPALADFQLGRYYSLDDALVAKRARALLAPPPGVTIVAEGGVLRVRGEAQADWIRLLETRAPMIAGVRAVDTGGLLLPGQSEFVRARGQLAGARILFNEGSAEIRPDQRDTFDAVTAELRTLDRLAHEMGDELSVEVVGHTDSTGPDSANQRLGQYRAARVMQSLVRAGLRVSIFQPRSVGSSQPLAGEDSEAERQINRCVTFRVVRPAAGAQP